MMAVDPARICLGTMRMDAGMHDVAGWADFLARAYDLGVRSLHVSTEYDSWDLICAVLAEHGKGPVAPRFEIVAKLGEPHFDQPHFDADRLIAAVAQYCGALGQARVDDVQWMWRADLKDEPTRLANFHAQADELAAAGATLKAQGRIGRLLCFPYTRTFADAAVTIDAFDGLVVYRNAQERECDPSLDAAHAAGKMAHVIRPFFAGATIGDRQPSPREQLVDALDHPSVERAILSTSQIKHLQSLIA